MKSFLYSGVMRETRITSVKAATSMEGKKGQHQRRVLDVIQASMLDPLLRGSTDDEIVQKTGLKHNSAPSRRLELWQGGYVWPTNRTRTTQSGEEGTVWITVPVDSRKIAAYKAQVLYARHRLRKGHGMIEHATAALRSLGVTP